MRVINIITYTGKKKHLRGSPRALVLRTQVKAIFDSILETNPQMRFVEAARKIAAQLDITDVRVRQILKNDWEFQVTRYSSLADSPQDKIKVWWESK